MISRYKNNINMAVAMLYLIKKYKIKPSAIVDLQLFLLKRIKNAERALKFCKERANNLRIEKANNRPTKERSKEIDQELEKIFAKRDEYNFIIYIWKTFGDGIAFAFCDKYALKHLLYDDKYCEKETAGFLSGKLGLRAEILFLKDAAKRKVPAILCDLTNTLRHGDVCLLGTNDPYPVEIKSSSKMNKRGEKQIKNIMQINDFFRNDSAENFRSQGVTLRRAHIGKERSNFKKINDCIARSYSEGTTRVEPEKGIFYVAITNFKENVFDGLAGRHIHAINLNDFKNGMRWHPYTPFTLLLEPEHIFNFIDGRVTLIILLDLQVIKKRYAQAGMNIIFLKDLNWYAQVTEDGNILNGGFRVSEQSFLRLAFEFQNLSWLIRQHRKELKALMASDEKGGERREIPKEWLDVDDGIPS